MPLVLDFDEAEELFLDDEAAYEEYLMHYGTPHEMSTPHSGRFPYGSGKNPFQRSGDFLSRYDHLSKKDGLSQKEIAKALGFRSTTELRLALQIAKHDNRQELREKALIMRSEGYSLDRIAKELGFNNDSSVRTLLRDDIAERKNQAKPAADLLRQQVDEKGFIDVGRGVERGLGISSNKMKEALYLLEREGYKIYYRGVPQATNQGQQTIQTILGRPDSEYKDIYQDFSVVQQIDAFTSTDGGDTFTKKTFHYPSSMDSSRLKIRYAEDGGKELDGTIEIRPGVKDLNLGEGVHYAQVRILVDDTHYLKGMAFYSNDLPPGVDVLFNTNKTKDVPALGPKDNTVLKPIKKDPENPFGSLIKEEGGQSFYTDQNGEQKLSLINKRAEEGDWGSWQDKIPSQFLSKQPLSLIDKQLSLSFADKKAEYDEIMALNNPTIKRKLLADFADDCDSSAVHLKAAPLPRQKYQVILPLTEITDGECYAPQYDDGETLALIRYPHGGTFEIPIVKNNLKNKQGKARITPLAKDAVGINSNVAERLSGADFDGDTVMVIPCNSSTSKVHIQSTNPLKGLEGFDPKLEYKIPEGDTKTKRMSKENTQKQMGIVSNLITDMTLKGANEEELARAVRHSMVVIDAEKHGLDYQRSYRDNRINELQKTYQGVTDPVTGKTHGGASTLISLAKSKTWVPKTKGAPDQNIIRETGEKVYKLSGETKINKKTGEEELVLKSTTKMSVAKDARELSSGTPKEERYAFYANQLKALALEARKNSHPDNAGRLLYKPSSAKLYSEEVSNLLTQLNEVYKNAPKERQANALANSDVKAKKQSNPDMDKKEIKKALDMAIKKRRAELGVKHKEVEISDRQWEAIQSGAISDSKLMEILNHTDLDKVRQRATPRATRELSSSKQARIKAMAASGYSISDIAKALGVSSSTVNKYI